MMKNQLLSTLLFLLVLTVFAGMPLTSHAEDECNFLGFWEGMTYTEAKKVVTFLDVLEERNGVKVVAGKLRKSNPAVDVIVLYICEQDGLGLIVANAESRTGSIVDAFEYWSSYSKKMAEKYGLPSKIIPDSNDELHQMTLLSVIREESSLYAAWDSDISYIPECLDRISVELFASENGNFWPKVIYAFNNYPKIRERFNDVTLEGF